MPRSLTALPLTAVLAVHLSACGIKADDFAAEFPVALCDYYDRCGLLEDFGFDGADACVTVTAPNYDLESRPCEHFQRPEANDCLAEMDTLACSDGLPTFPAACDRVCP